MTNLQVVTWPVERLIPYARNARTHSDEQVAQVAASIAEFGFVNPILVGPDGVIIAGHARLLAARKLRMTDVPVLVLGHLTETQRRALVLADNRLALNAGWDEEMLKVELESLREDGFDLDIVGFTDEEIEDLLRDPEQVVEGNTDEDAAPELPETAVTVEGDLWVLGEHRLLCGDSTQMDAIEKVLAGGLADMVFTDPPYNVNYGATMKDKLRGKKRKIANDTIRIEQRVWHQEIGPPKTEASRRVVGLGDLASRLREEALRRGAKPEDWVFPQKHASERPMWDSTVREALHEAARAEGCDFRGLGAHTFRRANITWRQEVGGSAIEASRIAGHQSLEMTSHYTFVAAERQNELTRRIQQKLAAAAKKVEDNPADRQSPPPAAPPTPEAPPSLADVAPMTVVVQ